MGLVITGMHRSGTSAVAGLVQGLGVDGGVLDMGPAPDNPRGFFERRDVMGFNDRWLENLGGSWWAPSPTTAATWNSLDAGVLRDARRQLDVFDPAHQDWFIKDPRLCLLLPLWDRLTLRNLPVLLCVRDPRDSANSLQLRDGISGRRALALWFAYLRQALLSSRNRRLAVVDYDQLIASREASAEGLAEFLTSIGLGPVSPSTLRRATALIEPELQRSHATELVGVSADELDFALDVFRAIAKDHGSAQAESLVDFDLPEWVDLTLADLRESFELERRAWEASKVAGALQAQLDTLADSDERLTVLQEEIQRREARLAEVAEGRDQLEEQAAQLHKDLAQALAVREELQAQVVDLETALIEVSQRLTDAESVAKEVAALGERLAQAEIRAATADRDLHDARERARVQAEGKATLQADVEILNGRLLEANARVSVLENELLRTREALESVENALRSLEVEAQGAAEHAAQEIEALALEASALAQRHERLKDASLQLHSRLTHQEALAADQVAEVSRLHENLVAADSSRQVLEHQVVVARAAEEKAQGQIHELERMLNEASSQASRLREEAERSKSRVSELESDRQAAADELAKVQSEARKSSSELDSARRTRKELERRLSEASSRIHALTGEVNTQTAALTKSQVEVQQVVDAHLDVTSELTHLRVANEQQAEALACLTASHERLRIEARKAAQEARDSQRWEVLFEAERARSQRLESALIDTIEEGQQLAERLDGILASRSYRYGRRLTAPGRLFRGDNPERGVS